VSRLVTEVNHAQFRIGFLRTVTARSEAVRDRLFDSTLERPMHRVRRLPGTRADAPLNTMGTLAYEATLERAHRALSSSSSSSAAMVVVKEKTDDENVEKQVAIVGEEASKVVGAPSPRRASRRTRRTPARFTPGM